jgi:hypothetical protein
MAQASQPPEPLESRVTSLERSMIDLCGAAEAFNPI